MGIKEGMNVTYRSKERREERRRKMKTGECRREGTLQKEGEKEEI